MRKNLGVKTFIYPQPVLIIGTYNEDGSADAMNAAWGCVSDMNKVTLYLSHSHKTVKNILNRKAFTVSIATADYVAEADYVGIVSANNTANKLEKAGLHSFKSEFVDAPLISEFPLALECKLLSYDTETECLIGEIINTCADEKILNDGKIDPSKLRAITFDAANNAYLVLGEKVGNAFKDGNSIK